MDFHRILEARYSVRAYRPDPVEPAALQACLEAAALAPTACNRQPFRLYVIHTAEHQEELARIYHREWFRQAPLVVAIAALPDTAWSRRDGVNYAFVDATIAMDHLILAAAEQGLGTCWVAAFDPPAARAFLPLPPGAEPVAFTPLGYPADEQPPRRRQPLATLVQEIA